MWTLPAGKDYFLGAISPRPLATGSWAMKKHRQPPMTLADDAPRKIRPHPLALLPEARGTFADHLIDLVKCKPGDRDEKNNGQGGEGERPEVEGELIGSWVASPRPLPPILGLLTRRRRCWPHPLPCSLHMCLRRPSQDPARSSIPPPGSQAPSFTSAMTTSSTSSSVSPVTETRRITDKEEEEKGLRSKEIRQIAGSMPIFHKIRFSQPMIADR